MNEKIKKHLKSYCEKNEWTWPDDPWGILEILLDGKQLSYEIGDSHRWYDEVEIVTEIDGMIIGFDWVHVTGDNSPRDMDLDLDLDSIREMEAKEVKKTIYINKEEK